MDLLHIDDVGAERTTDWVLEELYSIVNARYEDKRSMVVTTNILDREALCEQITERTVSRLTEMCDELPLLGHDRRMDCARHEHRPNRRVPGSHPRCAAPRMSQFIDPPGL